MGIHTKYGRIKEFISKRTQAVMPSLMQITVVSTLACIRGGVRLPNFLSYAQSAHSHWGFNQQIKLLCFLCRWFRSQRKLTGKIQSLTKRDIMILYSVDGWFVWCTACKKSTFRYNFLLSCKFKTLIRSLLQNCDLRWSCRSVCESICHSGTQYELSLLCYIVNLSQCHIIKFVNDTLWDHHI